MTGAPRDGRPADAAPGPLSGAPADAAPGPPADAAPGRPVDAASGPLSGPPADAASGPLSGPPADAASGPLAHPAPPADPQADAAPGPPADPLAPRIARLLDVESQRTRARLHTLTRDRDDIIERSNDAARDDEHDPEGATIAFERAQVTALIESCHAQLQDIEVAVSRLAAGSHGRCESCGAAVATERRLARPTARTCVACAA